MAYFTFMRGLRGCYMPDDVWTAKVDTRRDLKALLMDERDHAERAPAKRTVTAVATYVWRYRGRLGMGPVLPTGNDYGVQICDATRAEYIANREE